MTQRTRYVVAYSEEGRGGAWRYSRYLGSDGMWYNRLDDGPIKSFPSPAAARKLANKAGPEAVKQGWAKLYGVAKVVETKTAAGKARTIAYIVTVVP